MPTEPDRSPPSRRGWLTVVILLLAASVAALLQRPPVEPIAYLDERVPVNIAHAGAQGHAPGNTLPAFEAAVELGAEVLEMDLQLTADDVLVTIHDGTVDRTTDGSGAVRDLTLAELKELEVGHEFEGPDGDRPFVGQGLEIPTLEEVFAAFPDAWMLLEMKPDGGPEIAEATARLLREHGREDRTIVASFDLDHLRAFRELLPDVPTNLPEGEGRTFHVLQLLGAHRWWTPPGGFLQVPVDFEGMRVVTTGFVQAAEHRGLGVQVWTINDVQEMHWLRNHGVHGIITDLPDRVEQVEAERWAAAQERAPADAHPGLGFVQSVQDRLPGLTAVMSAITWLGDEEFYVLVFPLLFWAVSRRVGVHLAVVFLLSATLNSIVKIAARTPRPLFIDPSLGLRAESTFGVPSGHAQNAVVVWGYLAAAVQRSLRGRRGRVAVWVAAGLLIVLLGFSRLQLGVHFPVDTVTGWALGLALLLAYLRWQAPVTAWVVALPARRQLWLAFAAAFGAVLLAVVVRVLVLGWELPASWVGVDPAHHPIQISSVVTPAATLFGLAAGLVFLGNRGGFSSDGAWWRRLLRIPLGLVGVAVLWFGLGELFPRGEDPIALVYRALRYAALGMWVAGLAPLLFVRLGLAGARPVDVVAVPTGGSTGPAGPAGPRGSA